MLIWTRSPSAIKPKPGRLRFCSSIASWNDCPGRQPKGHVLTWTVKACGHGPALIWWSPATGTDAWVSVGIVATTGATTGVAVAGGGAGVAVGACAAVAVGAAATGLLTAGAAVAVATGAMVGVAGCGARVGLRTSPSTAGAGITPNVPPKAATPKNKPSTAQAKRENRRTSGILIWNNCMPPPTAAALRPAARVPKRTLN